jgi:hypothetical protein
VLSAGTVTRYAARVFEREKVLCLAYVLKASGANWPDPGRLDGGCYPLGSELPNSEDRVSGC